MSRTAVAPLALAGLIRIPLAVHRGLDSTTALRLVHTLRALASGGRAIITTIHQPSSRMYNELDKLLLLSEGHVLYYGDARQAVPWFRRMGQRLPYGVNPADFLLDLASADLGGSVPLEESDKERWRLVRCFEAFSRTRVGGKEQELRRVHGKAAARYSIEFDGVVEADTKAAGDVPGERPSGLLLPLEPHSVVLGSAGRSNGAALLSDPDHDVVMYRPAPHALPAAAEPSSSAAAAAVVPGGEEYTHIDLQTAGVDKPGEPATSDDTDGGDDRSPGRLASLGQRIRSKARGGDSGRWGANWPTQVQILTTRSFKARSRKRAGACGDLCKPETKSLLIQPGRSGGSRHWVGSGLLS